MDNENIFVVTAIKINHVQKNLRNKKTKAWFQTIEDAENYVLNNISNMFEGGKFEHAVIETIASSRLLNVVDETWYEALYSYYDWDLYKIQGCAKPKPLKSINHFVTIKNEFL